MDETLQVINRFYTSFQQHDVKGMQECYHPSVAFSDEVFPLLVGKKAHAMWNMLIQGAARAGLKISFQNIQTTGNHGSCEWGAHYLFSATGRHVHNRIHATFEFKDGLIIRHIDTFDFWRWSRQAFGFTGMVLGGTPFFKKKVQKGVAQRLEKFIAHNSDYQ